MKPYLFLAPFMFMSMSALAAEQFTLDPARTTPHFVVSNQGYEVMQGRFTESSGSVVMDRVGSGSSVQVSVQTASMTSGNDQRDAVVRGPALLDVARYPEMVFKSTGVRYTGTSTAEVTGDLSLHGVTRPLSLIVTRIDCAPTADGAKSCVFEAKGALKRSDFNIIGTLPNVLDEVEIQIEAVGLQN